jgi:hypothetical protein
MESDTMILLLITISLIVIVIYNQFYRFEKNEKRHYRENYRDLNNNKKVSVLTDNLGDNTINKKDLYKYNKIYRKNICLDNKNKKKYKKKIEIIENEIDSLDNLLNNNDMKSLNNIDNNTLSDIETFVK